MVIVTALPIKRRSSASSGPNEAEGKFWLQIVKQRDYRDPNFDYSKFFTFAPDGEK
jgi:hypothetical protein